MPRRADGTADPAKTLRDRSAGLDETWTWNTPRTRFPAGGYLIRIDTFRASERLHYSRHQEKIYVYR